MAAGNLLLTVSAIGASQQSTELQQQLSRLGGYYALPASSVRETRRDRFQRLARQWRAETQWLSSTTDIAAHPAYQAIIGMGDVALPWILDDLRRHADHWFWALRAISSEDPVQPSDRGAIKKMREAWLRWGERKSLVPR